MDPYAQLRPEHSKFYGVQCNFYRCLEPRVEFNRIPFTHQCLYRLNCEGYLFFSCFSEVGKQKSRLYILLERLKGINEYQSICGSQSVSSFILLSKALKLIRHRTQVFHFFVCSSLILEYPPSGVYSGRVLLFNVYVVVRQSMACRLQ